MGNKVKILILFLFFTSLSFQVFSQGEDCTNGIDDDGDGLVDCQDADCDFAPACQAESDCGDNFDNDGDGLVDCYDSDCMNSANCDGTYMNNDVPCEAPPTSNPFEMKIAWESENITADTQGRPTVGDIDGDSIPEIIVANRYDHSISILNGSPDLNDDTYFDDGTQINTLKKDANGDPLKIDLGFEINSEVTIGDIDNDGDGEIFVTSRGGTLRCYDHELNLLWEKNNMHNSKHRILGLADFNGDGSPELYYSNEIRDAQTGDILVDGSGDWNEDINAMSVAVDILPAVNGLELVVGHIIYSVNTGGGTWTLTEERNLNNVLSGAGLGAYHPKYDGAGWQENNSSTSIADYNTDGSYDVILSGALGSHTGPTTVFLWDVANSTVKTYTPTDNWERGTGRINIADINNDGLLEVTFQSGDILYALDNNFDEYWINDNDFQEGSSGFTGTSVFDFNGDGASEIVYRDEINLYIVDGATGDILSNYIYECSSQTATEYPVIADVDGDGETEICVTCGTHTNVPGQPTATNNTREEGVVRIFEAADGEKWVPSRKLWNQHGYFNVNVNDDLTIPTNQQDHLSNFSENCVGGSGTDIYPLNNFLNQSPFINSCGEVTFPAPDLTLLNDSTGGVDNTITIDPPVCPDDSFSVSISIRNDGNNVVSGTLPVSFYNNNPLDANANPEYLDTKYINLDLQEGDVARKTMDIKGKRGAFWMFISVNDEGKPSGTDPDDFYPLTYPNGGIIECDYSNNVDSLYVEPLPFKILAEVISDNRVCEDTLQDNGKAYVYDANGDTLASSRYQVEWFDVNSGDQVSSQPAAEALAGGDYRVEVTDTIYNCRAKDTTITIQEINQWNDNDTIVVEVVQPVSKCFGANDGSLKANVVDKTTGDTLDNSNFTFTWTDIQLGNVEATGPIATGLRPVNYQVDVFNKTNGCQNDGRSSSLILPTPQVDSDYDVTPRTACGTPDGKIEVTANGGQTSGYHFRLVNKQTQDTTTRSDGIFENLLQGEYHVVAINDNTLCGTYSDEEDVIVPDNRDKPDIQLSVESEQTACDPAKYNGQLTGNAVAIGGSSSTYNFEWYRGTVTSGPGAVMVSDTTVNEGDNAPTPDTLSTQFTNVYTVLITDDKGCTFDTTINLTENIQNPVIDPTQDISVSPNYNCVNPNGEVRATVNGDTTAYTFRLYEGTNTTTPPPYIENSNGIFSGLTAQKYTVVALADSTGCASDPLVTVEVQDSTAAPQISVTSKQNQTSCNNSTPNGSVSVTADGSTDTIDYNFYWENQAGDSLGNTATVDSLPKGNYRVTVTNKNTGCKSNKVVAVNENPAEGDDIELVLNSSAVTQCNPLDGSIEVTDVLVNGSSTGNINGYDYTWYEIITPGTDSVMLSNNGPVLDSLDEGNYSVYAVSNNTTCQSATYQANVADNKPDLDIEINTLREQGDCVDPDGGIEAVVDPSGSYDYQWHLGKSAVSTNLIPGATSSTLDSIRADHYTVVVTDQNTGCTYEETFELDADGDILPVPANAVDANIQHSTSCLNPNGRIEARVDTSFGRYAAENYHPQNDFDFYWFEGENVKYESPLPAPGNLDSTLNYDEIHTGPVYDNLAPGEYTVVIVDMKDGTQGCRSKALTFTIEEHAKSPGLVSKASDANYNCEGPNGELSLTIGKRSGDQTTYNEFSFAWEGPNGTLPNSQITTTPDPGNEESISVATNLEAGNYEVTVTDNQTGCDTLIEMRVTDSTFSPIITGTDITHLQDCETPPSGRIEVTGMELNGTPANLDDYHYYWYADESDFNPNNPGNNTIKTGDAGVFGDRVLNNQTAGTYFVAAAHQSTGCISFAEEVTIEDQRPDIEIYERNNQPFVSCTGNNEGLLEIKVQGASGPFTYEWYNVTGSGQPVPAGRITNSGPNNENSRVDSLTSGDYRVVVTDQVTQCVDSATFTIDTDRKLPKLAMNKVSDMTSCEPDGHINLSSLTLDGVDENISDYSFTWYEGSRDAQGRADFNNAGYSFTSGDSTEVTDLTAGTYFVVAQKTDPAGLSASCKSVPVQIIIEDNTIPPSITLDDVIDPVTGCDPSQIPDGEIEIQVSSNGNYSVSWFRGINNTDPVNEIPRLNGNLEADSLTAGNYTVQVRDSATNCISTRTYTVDGIIDSLSVNLSSSPYLNCISPDGRVAANANGGSGNYTFAWFAGNPADTAGQYLGANNLVENLPDGTYTVKVYDNEEFTCDTVIQSIDIIDQRGDNIMVNITEDFPVTNCDEEKPNGQLSASMEGNQDPSRFNYFWYRGTNTSGNPIGVGPTMAGLSPGTYSVIAKDKVSGCLSPAFTKTVNEGQKEEVPAPEVEITSHLTNCNEPNGGATAMLPDSLTQDNDYTYTWYSGNNAVGRPIYTDARSNKMAGMETGTYTVTATNQVTGCVSPPGTFTIEERFTFPEFTVETTPSVCDQSNGSARVVFQQPTKVRDVNWKTPTGYDTGFEIKGYPAGDYEVTVINGYGCETTVTTTIESNINVYNGVSPNGDGQNEFFRISCIDNFENNDVKIYNRAGALVFEKENYDNEVNNFEGRGNRGLYVGGKKLPDGTYFYVIDKNNGDKPKSGYLELAR